MADRRKRSKRKRVKRTWGKPPIPPPSLRAGEVQGELRVIRYIGTQGSHRLVLVEDVVTGERGEVRADNLANGNTVSLGRIKRERQKEHMAKTWTGNFTDLDSIDAGTMANARAILGVDSHGKKFDKADPKPKAEVKPVAKPQPVQANPEPVKKMTRAELAALGLVDAHTGYWTTKGTTWRDAGKPDLRTWTPSRAPEPTAKETPPLEAVKPEPVEARKDTLMRDVPYEQTEAGYAALGNYWREFKHEPPNDFNLKQWAKGR
jgi:hypothetical protein